ncbi:MFS transporter [Polynucleobacter sp. IMCC30063]|uniref:MFS transporter n=1 Tax=unclassified Polynucleobacter TaxID=2640945 RepID=UPI001F1CDAC1|nr:MULTISPECIES: MFS transporter [unclassified Polynucleobacter]MCE7506449.1 MFS transporter [Polynucleobacter sp. IMCC30063]MCE7529539.1 MFS transporter [Polynucleobacter sp. IMCC 29146]
MNSPKKVIGFINLAHFIDHYAMLVFAAAVIVMAPVFNMTYAQLLPYATPGFIAFGAGSLISGWLGDRWSRRNMLAIFFIGMGSALLGTALIQTPMQLGIALFAVGIIASIYHPVGMAMLTSYSAKLGRELGINGVYGNLGVASSALITGLICEYLGWRWAFVLPGVIAIVIGLIFMKTIHDEKIAKKSLGVGNARVSKNVMALVVVSLVLTIIASSTTFNAITVALPKLFQERLAEITQNTALLGLIASTVYVFGALAQYTIGNLLDKYPLKKIFMPLAIFLVAMLYVAAETSGFMLILVSIGIVISIFGQVTVNDTMVGKYTSDEWRARAFAVRYFLGFTAAGASVGLVALLYANGGFTLMLQAFAAFCFLVVIGAFIFPTEQMKTSA